MQPACPLDDLVVEEVRFQAGPTRLKGELAYPAAGAPVGAVVLAGPHPLLGGTMRNNVIRGLGDGLVGFGLVTLRFDYHDIGASAPDASIDRLTQFWETSRLTEDVDLLLDLSAAVSFLRAVAGATVPLALVGYSFGCSLLAGVLDSGSTTPVVLVAPTIGTHEYSSFLTMAAPKLVIAPEGDFAANAGLLEEWYANLLAPKELIRPRLDGHFFRGHEGWLTEVVNGFLSDNRR